jgi:hypothetical protein
MEDPKAPLIPLEPPPEPKSELTFGIEIEFVVATAPVNEVDPQPELCGQIFEMHDRRHYTNERLVGAHICQTLNKYRIPAELHNGIFGWKPSNTLAWSVRRDASIRAPEPGLLYEWQDIEINSPTFQFSEAALNQVRRVCRILNKEYRINCNRSCGLHVHVGNAMAGFSYEVIRNLMATIWTFEPQIDTLHPLHRLNNSTCPGFRGKSQLAKRPQVLGDPKKGLEILLSKHLKNFNRLKELTEPVIDNNYFSGGTRMGYHLGDPCALLEPDNWEGLKRTIEFRQHKSTLDGSAVAEWIEFCIRLVGFANDVSPELLYPWLRAHVGETPEQYSLAQVCIKIRTYKMAYLLPKRIQKNKEEEKRRREMGWDDSKCYTIQQGMTDPKESEGINFQPTLFEDFPTPQVEG